jgi:hypothetical protein
MPISIYSFSVPVFTRKLTALLAILNKAEAYATERKIDLTYLVNDRIAPDMIPLKGQIQIATDHAKFGAARLAGRTAPSWPDDETTFEQLKARVQKALDYLATFSEADLAGSDDREITVKVSGQERQLKGEDYLLNRALPHFYFHVVTAYDILRKNGAPIGKGDYMA